MSFPGVIGKAGERVTCEGGHVICTLAKDISVGDFQDPDNTFKDWQQKKPFSGQVLPILCEVCGLPWFSGGVPHVEDRWFRAPPGWKIGDPTT